MTKLKGVEGFNQYYFQVYQDDWEELKLSLINHQKSYVHITKNSTEPFMDNSYLSKQLPPHDSYSIEVASIYPVLALEIQKGDIVLDLCAAPGGKSLAILAQEKASQVVLNEKSRTRYARLKRNIEQFYSGQTEIRFAKHDAGGWCLYEQDLYDKILLDAPCSSEAHVLNSPDHLKDWSLGRTKRLAKEQYKILSSALIALKPGGRLVYSTCSISPLENDEVIRKVIAKKKGFVIEHEIADSEETEFGHLFLPHKSGIGPIYLCVLSKVKDD